MKVSGLKGKVTVNWKYDAVEHRNYTDLGDYVIDLGVFNREEYLRGIKLVNRKVDAFSAPMCTGIVKRNKKGEVILGRNQDLEVSNYPVFISHLAGGKHQAVAFYYNNILDITYEQFKKGFELSDDYREMYAAAASDAFNEKGLYLQCNMRWGGDHPSSGTNPGGLRISMGTLAGIVAQNCATVKETIEFIKTLDVFSAGATSDGAARSGWDGGYMIGDATGDYGVIEFANNTMYFTPYANGHCNAFVAPQLQSTDRFASGYGRLAMGQQSMFEAETAEDMMEAIHKADWRREIEDIMYTYRDEQGRIHFVDKDGNPSIDWRCECTSLFPVDDSGKLCREQLKEDELLQLRKYLDWVSKADYSVPLDLSIKEQITPELKAKLDELNTAINNHYLENCTAQWLMNDANFDDVRDAYIAYFTANNAFELVRQFNEGDETAIRNKGDIFTTGMNFGVNCAEKYLMVRFWEHKDTIYEYQW